MDVGDSQIENHVQAYAVKATSMKLLPAMAKNAFGVDYDIELDAHTGGVAAAQQLSLHLKQHIRPALLNFQKNRSDRRSVALDEVLQLQGDVEHSRALLSVEREKEQALEARAKKIDDTVRREREAREHAIAHKIATTEDVELQIEAILNEKDVNAQEAQTRQELEAVKKTCVCGGGWAVLTTCDKEGRDGGRDSRTDGNWLVGWQARGYAEAVPCARGDESPRGRERAHLVHAPQGGGRPGDRGAGEGPRRVLVLRPGKVLF